MLTTPKGQQLGWALRASAIGEAALGRIESITVNKASEGDGIPVELF